MPTVRITFPSDRSAFASIRASGDIDAGNGGALANAVDAAIAASCRDIVLDLSAVTFMDSTGLSELVHSRNACASAGAALRLHAPPHNVLRLLEITGLVGAFTVTG